MAAMNFTYENQGTITYLVYAIQPNDVVDTMGLGMMTNNKIPGLAATQFTQMDANRYIKFNVSAKIPVSQFFSGAVNRKRLIGAFKGIVSALISAEEYMIDPNCILLDLDYIYTDVSTCDTVLICLPVQQDHPPVNLGQFFKNIMFSTQFDQTENCDYVAKIMNYLNSTPAFSTYDFAELMDQLQKGGAPAAPVQNVAYQQPAPERPAPAAQPQPAPAPAKPAPMQPPVQPPMQQPVPNIPQQQFQSYQPIPQRQNQPIQPQNPIPMQQGNVQSFNVPSQFPQKPADSGEKKQSFFGGLFHSNKNKAEKAPAPEKHKKEKKSKEKNGPAMGFAVPGASGGPGFAIPGQPAAPVPSANFQAPKQPAVPQPAARGAVPQPAAPKQQSFAPQPAAPVQQRPAAPVSQPIFQAPKQPAGQPMNFGETTVLGGGGGIGETTVLGGMPQQEQAKPHLIRTKNNERINIDKPVFRIGKERSYVDYFVADNPAISRSHANIISRDGMYFVTDTNSTNHTYVNGGMIQSNAEVKLSHGTKIRLANEEFEFRLY